MNQTYKKQNAVLTHVSKLDDEAPTIYTFHISRMYGEQEEVDFTMSPAFQNIFWQKVAGPFGAQTEEQLLALKMVDCTIFVINGAVKYVNPKQLSNPNDPILRKFDLMQQKARNLLIQALAKS